MPVIMEPNDAPIVPAVLTRGQAFGERFLGHGLLDDEVAGGEHRRNGQTGEDLHQSHHDQVAPHRWITTKPTVINARNMIM